MFVLLVKKKNCSRCSSALFFAPYIFSAARNSIIDYQMVGSCKLINIISILLAWQEVNNWEANALGQVDLERTSTLQFYTLCGNNLNICS